MKLVLAALCLIGLLAFTKMQTGSIAVASTEPTAGEVNSTPVTGGEDDTSAICPRKWTCDQTGFYYSTKAACTSACGATACYLDYACTGGCVCP
jgi:hypothetical protein